MAIFGRKFTLVSFDSHQHCKSVQDAVARLGYLIEIPPLPKWLEPLSSKPTSPVIFFFGRTASSPDAVRSALDKAEAVPRLGIFLDKEMHWDSDVICRCSDLATWPCQDRELQWRLDRAWSSVDAPLSPPNKAGKFIDGSAALELVGRSASFLKALTLIRKVASFDTPVLILGETGTGKELAAHAVHCASERRDYPFVPINCGAVPDSLLENELFGHERGAFTDAKEAHAGLVEQAAGGTLFLDEVEVLSARAQVGLLRFLQDHEYRPLGGKQVARADVRVISASNADLQTMVERGEFREDLLFRLDVVSVAMPPLRERLEDIELLAEHFIRQCSHRYQRPAKSLDLHMLAWMKTYHWPGNVRELENLLHRSYVLTDGPVIDAAHAKNASRNSAMRIAHSRRTIGFEGSFNDAKARAIIEFERHYLIWLMVEFRGNVTHAARHAGKERRALGKLLKKHRICREDYAEA